MSDSSIKAFVQQSSAKRYPVAVATRTEEDTEHQSVSYGKIGTRPEIMLEIHRADGYRESIPYIDIRKIVTSDPSVGFIIKTNEQEYRIEGANLENCYRLLKQNRVAEIREASRPEFMAIDSAEAVVSKLIFGTK